MKKNEFQSDKSPREIFEDAKKNHNEAESEGYFFTVIFIAVFLVLNIIKTGMFDAQIISIAMAGQSGIAYHHYKRTKSNLNLATFLGGLFVAIVSAIFYLFP